MNFKRRRVYALRLFFLSCRETTVSPTRCVLTALRAAEHGRPNVPIRKRSPSQSQKTEVHAPGFLEFAKQILSKRARSARKARRRRAFFASLRDAAHAKRALSPAVFRQSRNRQDRRTAVRRIKFPIKVQLCRTFIPLPAPRRRGLVRRADERGVSQKVSSELFEYPGGTESPLENAKKPPEGGLFCES